MGTSAPYQGQLDGSGMRFGVVVGRFNEPISRALLDGATRAFADHGVDDAQVTVVWVPGAFEIPVTAQRLAQSGEVDAVITLGAVIRGDTPHFEYVAGECASGMQRVALDAGIPVMFGVLTTDDLDQALVRCQPDRTNKGYEAATGAIEMVDVLRQLPKPPAS